MQRFINNPDEVVEDTLRGFVKAHADIVRLADNNPKVVAARKAPVAGKVGVITGGGSGHEPAFIGYIGDAMLDAVAVGELFSSPTAKSFLDAAREANAGKGVVCLYGNYAGDNMNFDMAAEFLAAEGIDTRTIRVRDDVAVGAPDRPDERRGIAGDVLVIKIAGGAAAELNDLDAVARVAAKAEANTRSMGVAVSPGSLPESGKPTFELGDDEIEIGMGAHGEKGVKRQKLSTADDIVDQMMAPILKDLPYSRGNEVALLVNNLGATTMFELLIANRRVRQILAREGITVHRSFVGSWLTSQEMAGFSISLMRLDEELKHYLDLPAASFGFTSL